jgi:hypothetical protein
MYLPLVAMCSIFIVFSIGSYVCLLSNMCFDVFLLVLMAHICSL